VIDSSSLASLLLRSAPLVNEGVNRGTKLISFLKPVAASGSGLLRRVR
jgi:hypothetical protein